MNSQMETNAVSYSLTNQDLQRIDPELKIITYKDLYKYKSIKELLAPYGKVAILFEIEPQYGHWTLLFKRPNEYVVEFFDSYGLVPDEELKFVPPKYQSMLRSNHTYLSKLILNSPYQLEYNPYPFQSSEPNVTTCGRWILLRSQYPSNTIDEFHSALLAVADHLGENLDQLVTKLLVVEA
jgi:hypothetical protein